MRKLSLPFAILLILAYLSVPLSTAAQSPDEPVVQAILFRSPTCPACHHVIEELLSPMVNDYGERLQIMAIDTSQSAGLELYNAAVQRYQIQQQGVPTLVIRDVVLIGSREIPDQFPSLVEEGLASGGIAWPDIPGLDQVPSEVQMTIGSQTMGQPVGAGTVGANVFRHPLFHLPDVSGDIRRSRHLYLVPGLGGGGHDSDAPGRGSRHTQPIAETGAALMHNYPRA